MIETGMEFEAFTNGLQAQFYAEQPGPRALQMDSNDF